MSAIPSARLLIDRPQEVTTAALALARGAVVAVAFGNFYAMVSDPSADTVRRVNLVKGRPADQVGSLTTTARRIPGLFDWSQLDRRLDPGRLRRLMDTMYASGPFGFRGPAADHLPDHLTQLDRGVRTAQVIAPGAACPSNAFFDAAVEQLGEQHLYITSANLSRQLTGAVEEPAHWMADGIAADFAHVRDLVTLAHRDEAAAQASYPAYLPTSVTLLSFHAPGGSRRPVLTIDRHGSLHIDEVRRVAAPLGFDITLGPTAQRRLRVRAYPTKVLA